MFKQKIKNYFCNLHKKIIYPFDVPLVDDYNDVFLQDLNHNHLILQISGILKHKYLTPHNNTSLIAKRTLFGPYVRPLVCLTVMSLNKK